MRKFIWQISMVFLLLLTMGAGCDEKNSDNILTVCGTPDPLTNLGWLKDLKASIEDDAEVTSSEIILYRLNNTDYIYVQKSGNTARDLPNTIYDCDGKEKYKCGGNQPIDNCTTFFSEAIRIKVLWRKE